MADAGLTNGAFYAHFASKDDLVATAVADQLREQRERFSALAPGRAGVEQYVREYLSIQHRDHPGEGCPSAALLDEIGRCTGAVKQAYTDGLLAVIDDIGARLAPDNPQSARVQTIRSAQRRRHPAPCPPRRAGAPRPRQKGPARSRSPARHITQTHSGSLWCRVAVALGQVLACLADRHARPAGGGADVGDGS